MSRMSLTGGASDRLGWLRVVIGVALVLAGAVFLLARAGISAAGIGIAAMLVTLAGVALITGPWWVKLASELSEERRERIRSEERADIAAALHDSVLQTLALIQRNAGSSREVLRLARSQERQLRATLYGANLVGGPFGAALHDIAAAVEDQYAVTIDVVVVGERTVDARLEALLAAAREAMTNAAKHSGVASISVYAEIEAHSVAVYVRDRGKGFDPAAVGADRLGVRGSIHARLQRCGGDAQITSVLGEGTEVHMRLPGE
jgi:signal transduction histidine kinase